MKILITGGAGFIGTNLTKHFLSNTDHEIVVVDRNSMNCSRLQSACGQERLRKFHMIDDDYINILDRIPKLGINKIVHLAAVPRVAYSVENPSMTTYENIHKLVSLMEATKGIVDRFVFASSSSVYGDAEVLPTPEEYKLNPQSPYALQKKTGEEYCKLFSTLYNMDTVCLRFFNVFGPNDYVDNPYATVITKWCHQLKSGEPLRLEGDGSQSRDFTYVSNVIDAIDKALNRPEPFSGEIFNVGNQEITSLLEILNYLRNYFTFEVENYPPREGDVKNTHAMIDKIKSTLNYEPNQNIWSGLEKTIKWWGLER